MSDKIKRTKRNKEIILLQQTFGFPFSVFFFLLHYYHQLFLFIGSNFLAFFFVLTLSGYIFLFLSFFNFVFLHLSSFSFILFIFCYFFFLLLFFLFFFLLPLMRIWMPKKKSKKKVECKKTKKKSFKKKKNTVSVPNWSVLEICEGKKKRVAAASNRLLKTKSVFCMLLYWRSLRQRIGAFFGSDLHKRQQMPKL